MTKLEWLFFFITPALVLVLAMRVSVYTGSYQYFKFVQQWQPTVCAVKGCSTRPKREFTIHGLWPSNQPWQNQPIYCSSAPRFVTNAIHRSLETKLNRSWPDLEHAHNMPFWKHEWNEHGTCSVQMYNQVQYFERGHEMWIQSNLTRTLGSLIPSSLSSRRSIVLRDSVVLGLIQAQAATKKKPLLRCRWDTCQYAWLWEIVICYQKDGTTLMDCPQGTLYWCPQDFNLLLV